MTLSSIPQTFQYDISEEKEGSVNLRIKGSMDASSAGTMIRAFSSFIEDRRPSSLTVDLGEVTYLDDFGVLVLMELEKMMGLRRSPFQIINAGEKTRETIDMMKAGAVETRAPLQKKPHPGPMVRLGEGALQVAADLRYLISFIGSVCLSFLHVILHPKSLRVNETLIYMQKTGVDAVPIVTLISFLLGLIMAFMSSVQLQQFGANIYVASLVSLAMTRELGPIMTAIVVAGRSGSAFAAEIGTMKINEEVDALFTMGFDPTRFLVVPKIIASVVVVPFLALFSDLLAMAGGLVVGIGMLDLTAGAYIAQTIKTLSLFDVFFGFFKSGVFAFLIAWIGCLRGFQVRGGAASVGRATTSAVVSSIFLIILTDSLFSVILRYWG